MIQVIGLIFWLLIVPFCIGLLPGHFMKYERKNPGVILLAGFLLMWSVFEVITIPAVVWILYDNFRIVRILFTVAALLLAAAGVFMGCLEYRKEKRMPWYLPSSALPDAYGKPFYKVFFAKDRLEARIMWLLVFVLIGFQLYMSFTRASFDGDDAFYVVQSLMTQQNGVMYRNYPYTGRSTMLDIRHALAVFPMWVAFVSVQSGMHATIVSHVVIPLVVIPLCYLVYYEIGKVLFISKKENVPVFLIIMALFQMFGNVSIYTNETFFLTRTWQGKAIFGSLVIPMLLLLMLWIYSDPREKIRRLDGPVSKKSGIQRETGIWIMLVCLNMTAGICSSIAVFLLAILLGVAAVCLAFVKRDITIPVKLALTCIPNGIYVLIFLWLR